MSITTSTSPGVSQRTNVYAERRMLKHAGPIRVLEKTGPLSKPMPQNKGVTIKFRRPIPFEPALTPLQEGVTPSPTGIRFEDVSGTLEQYGEVSVITDVIEDTHEDPILQEIEVQLGENIGRTMEALDYAVLRGGTNVFYANGSARTDVNMPVSLAKLRAVSRGLKAQKAMKITQGLDSGPDYASFPIEAAYVIVGHSDLESDIRNLPGFKNVSEYASRKVISEHEIGSCEEFRFLLSADLDPFADAGGLKGSMVSTTGTSADVYPMLAFGKEAWGQVALRGQGAISPSIIPVGQKTKDDPLGQRGYAGWKGWHLALILNQLWMARLEVACTAL
jgi:N4-gp56 family major capsid protein